MGDVIRDGLHQAIEAKENVKIEAATQTFATVTLQNYFECTTNCRNDRNCVTEAGEFWEIYKLDVVEIPTNRPYCQKRSEICLQNETRKIQRCN